MQIWVRCHLDVLVLLLIEADILYSLWPEKFPQTVFLLVLGLSRVAIASLDGRVFLGREAKCSSGACKE
jgi:hypothetical protein